MNGSVPTGSYFVGGWIGESRSHSAYMALQRSRRQGHVDAEDVQRFQTIIPHMRQALALSVRLGTLDLNGRIGFAFLQALQHGAFILDGDGSIIVTNAAADSLIAESDGLALRGGRLECLLQPQQARLDRLVRAAIEPAGTAEQGGWLQIGRPSGRASYVALVSRFVCEEPLFSTLAPKAMVIVSAPDRTATVCTEMLCGIYALTETEARLASAIAGGHSVESAAALLGMQVGTARFHLKAIFAKLGVNRQQDLVRILISLSTIKAARDGPGIAP